MDEAKIDRLWTIMRLATNIDNIDYDAAVTIGSVFGEMKAEILRLKKKEDRLNKLLSLMDSHNIIKEDSK